MNRFMDFTLTVLKLNKLVQKIKLLEVSDYGLKSIHVMSLYCILTYENITAGELSRLTLEDKGAISRALNYLRVKGYLEHDFKKYGSPLRLTEEGKKIAEYVCKRADCAVDGVGKGIADEERAVLYETLSRISDNIEAYYEELKKSKRG